MKRRRSVAMLVGAFLVLIVAALFAIKPRTPYRFLNGNRPTELYSGEGGAIESYHLNEPPAQVLDRAKAEFGRVTGGTYHTSVGKGLTTYFTPDHSITICQSYQARLDGTRISQGIAPIRIVGPEAGISASDFAKPLTSVFVFERKPDPLRAFAYRLWKALPAW